MSTVVIDNGSGIIKAGFAGDDLPQCILPSIVGVAKHKKCMPGALEGNLFVGNMAEKHRGLLKLIYPMEHGVIKHNCWQEMEKLWTSVYSELKVMSEEHPVLLTEAPHTPHLHTEKAAEIFFETFNVPALFVAIQAVLALYASSSVTGVVLDCGDGVTHAVPIYEGYTIPHAITRVDLAGRDVTSYLQLQLRKSGHVFHTSAEFEIVRKIKESACYVALQPQKEELSAQKGQLDTVSYKLPDGHNISLGPERFRAPEILFNPALVGSEYDPVHEVLLNAIRKSDVDIRKHLFANIHLAGGSTLCQGFGERLFAEVRQRAKDAKLVLHAPPERKYTTWVGGSILASLATFKNLWTSAEEYKEQGPRAIHRNAFA
eukprot:TRINITY_DN3617_c0_g1_i1.p2 TRINITY_DN3617_c0_g1~~TRINITY_DN3617_c0_g1_i1.p2  ORF type:complete len:373 (-),score=45.18 TRINITY_DN3617_c0_g1_i1:1723-2841(-)